MNRVTGIGGVFFKSKDPNALGAWYRTHLGINVEEWGGVAFSWVTPENPTGTGTTVWSPFTHSLPRVEQKGATWMPRLTSRSTASSAGSRTPKEIALSCGRRPKASSRMTPFGGHGDVSLDTRSILWRRDGAQGGNH